MAKLALSSKRSDGVTLVVATGEVDTSTASELGDALASVPDENVVISLEAVRYIDSSGLTVLVRAHKERIAAGFLLYIVLPQPPADRVFEITNLSGLFPCFRHLNEALHAARADEASPGAA